MQKLTKPAYKAKGPLFKITPTFAPPFLNDKSFQLYINSVETLIQKMIDPRLIQQMQSVATETDLLGLFDQLSRQLPLFKYSHLEKTPCTLSVVNFCKSESAPGVGRYIADMLSRGLVPGKQLPLVGSRTLSFEFTQFPGKSFYLCENYIKILSNRELETVHNQIQSLLKEIRINILAVNHAKFIASAKNLSIAQKSTIVEKNLSPLLNNKQLNYSSNIQHFMKKVSTEEAIDQIKGNISKLMDENPKLFGHDVFYEIGHFLMRFRETFIAERDPRHVSKIISLQYLLKKSTIKAIEKKSNERHLTLKLLNTSISMEKKQIHVMGFLICMNTLRDSESFDKRNILQAARSCLANIQFVKNSYIVDSNHEKIRCFYLEVQKRTGDAFTQKEEHTLKTQLPAELQARIQSTNHPIFMPRNEEEILRNIISLSKQLKYVRDIPQAIVQFDKQTDEELSFLITIVRLLKKDSTSLTELLFEKKKSIRFSLDEIKTVGQLKNKYIKEAGIFHGHLKKASFFRKDFSLDLPKARRKITNELTKMIGEFRDFNGGLIFKSQEALEKLKKRVPPKFKKHELLLENYFYSIRPSILQNIIPVHVMKMGFEMFFSATKHDYKNKSHFFMSESHKKYFVACIAAKRSCYKDSISHHLTQLKIPEVNLATSHLKVEGVTISTYIYRSSKPQRHVSFLQTLLNAAAKCSSKKKKTK